MSQKIDRFHIIAGLSGGLFVVIVLILSALILIASRNQAGTRANLDDLAVSPGGTAFEALVEQYKDQFVRYWPDGATPKTYREVLDLGRDLYIAEGCWQCHTQQVRPVANEDLRYGAASTWPEVNNALMVPQLLGTRRVGPDLSRVAGKYSNNWHVAHFWNPRDVVPDSIMPRYEWFFEEKGIPNDKGFAIIAYMQWLGTYQPAVVAEE